MAAEKPIIAVIPGAFHRPSHYDSIIAPLRTQGYTVISVPLVATGDDPSVVTNATIADDKKKLHEHLLPLLGQGHEAVLVGHSYGSLVVTAAIQGQTKEERAQRGLKGGVIGAVWIAGFCFPVRGKNITGGDEAIPVAPYQKLENGLLSLNEKAKGVFYSGVAAEVADAAFASLCKFQSYLSFNVPPQFIESDITVPKAYLFCETDQAVPPPFQEAMIGYGNFQKVVKFDSGHSPFLVMPGKVVDEIIQFCSEIVSG